MELDKDATRLRDIVRELLFLPESTIITTLHLQEALKVVGKAYRLVNALGPILDQWRALLRSYNECARNEGLDSAEERFPLIIKDFEDAVAQFEKSKPIAKHYYFIEELLSKHADDVTQRMDQLALDRGSVKIQQAEEEPQAQGTTRPPTETPAPSERSGSGSPRAEDP